jgi:hypothetical protein
MFECMLGFAVLFAMIFVLLREVRELSQRVDKLEKSVSSVVTVDTSTTPTISSSYFENSGTVSKETNH